MQRSSATYGSAPAPAPAPPKTFRQSCASLGFVLSAVLLPWGVFVASFWALSFSMHYRRPEVCWYIVELCGAVTVLCGLAAVFALQSQRLGRASSDPTMLVFTFVSLILGLVLGSYLGQANYSSNMLKFYQVTGMNSYPLVDPSRTRGQQVNDAGRIVFARESTVGVPLSMGFQSGDTYCVAPILNSHDRLASYDFWAVGINCCTSGAQDFHCGASASPRAHAGVRLLDTGHENLFRLAVKEAELKFGIQAESPLFFEWVEDPISDMNAVQETGFRAFLLGIFLYFAVQLVLAVLVNVGFSQKPLFPLRSRAASAEV